MNAEAAYLLVGFALLYYIVGIFFIFHFRNEDLMQKRQPTVIFLMSIASGVIGMDYIFSSIDYFTELILNTECTVLVFVSNFVCPVWMFALFLRCAHLASTYTQQRVQVNNFFAATAQVIGASRAIEENSIGKNAGSLGLSGSMDGSFFQQTQGTSAENKTQKKGFEQRTNLLVIKMLKRVYRLLCRSEELFYKCTRHKMQNDKVETKSGDSFKISKASIPILLAWIFLVHLVYVTVSFLAVAFILNVNPIYVGCYDQIYYLTYVDSLIFMIFAPLFLVAIRSMKDSLFIRFELNISIVLFYIAFILYFYDTIGVKEEDQVFRNLTPLIICSLATFFLSTYLPTILILYHRYHHSRHLNCTPEDLDRVLQDRALCKELRKVAAKQFTIESINFLLDMKDFDKRRDPNFPETLFNTYIKHEASAELNIPHEIRTKIEKARVEGLLTFSHFEAPEEYIRSLVLFNTFSEYVSKKYSK